MAAYDDVNHMIDNYVPKKVFSSNPIEENIGVQYLPGSKTQIALTSVTDKIQNGLKVYENVMKMRRYQDSIRQQRMI